MKFLNSFLVQVSTQIFPFYYSWNDWVFLFLEFFCKNFNTREEFGFL